MSKITRNLTPTPDSHFAPGPDCRVIRSASGRVGEACWSPRVVGARLRRLRAVSPAGVQIAAVADSAPDDHLAAGPYCRVEFSASGCAGGAGGCPTVGAGIISAAGGKIAEAAIAAPDDYFAASPPCCVMIA